MKKRQDDGGRADLTDEQWVKIQPLLPPQKAWTGKPASNHRQIVDGILWLHRTGAPWRDIPERYGKHSTISSRFYRWRIAGVWQQIWENLMQQADVAGKIDWEVHFVDGTIVRAHQHAGGAKGGGPETQALGRSVGGLSTKVHIKAEGFGKPMNFVLTGGERHEAVTFPELVKGGKVKRQGRGRPKYRSQYLAGDNAGRSQEIRQQQKRKYLL